MTDSPTKQIQDVQALLAERRKYEQWIAQLEARKESTPAHVYTKVHGDYVARLSEAQQKLSSESGTVQKLAAELEASLATQERQIGEKTDERAEAQLRATVGEYTEKEWDKLRNKLDAAIAELTGEKETVQRELAALRALLSEAAAPVPPAAPSAPAPPPRRAPPPEPPLPSTGKVSEAPALRDSAAVARPSEPAAPTEKKGEVDELEFLRSVLGRTTPYTGAGGHRAITEPSSPPEPPPASAEPAPRPSGAGRASGAAAGRASGATAARARESFPVPEPPIPEPEPHAREAPEPEEEHVSSVLGPPTPRTSEAVRSLKCQECGTLNFPTEWYCERCGGELAAF